jgi:hypothetical protein
MALVEWNMQGVEVTSCSCHWGCPCQFNAPPSAGYCRAYAFTHIEKGHFGEVALDGLRWGILAAWPGPIHQGNGTLQAIVDERANAKQRAALEAVAHGRETEPGKLVWQVFASMVTKVLPTLYKPIDLSIDLKASTAKVVIPDVVDSSVGPITNPVTGAPHFVHVRLPKGMEFNDAEFASSTAKTRKQAGIELDFDRTHAHLARVHWGTHGVVA